MRKGDLTASQAQEIIRLFVEEGRSPKEIAAQFGLHFSTVGRIVCGGSWPDLIRPDNLIDVLRRRGCHSLLVRAGMPPLSLHQCNLITGSLLGDGSLTKPLPRKNSAFRKTQKYCEHLMWLAKELLPYGREKLTKFRSKNSIGYIMRTIAHPIFTSLRLKWYPGGIKVVPLDLVLNPEILSIWYVDDGCNCTKLRTCHIATNSFTVSEVEFLVHRLSVDLGLCGHIYKVKRQQEQPTLRFHGESYDKLLELVAPYVIWDCFAYKIIHRLPQKVGRPKGSKNKPELCDCR